MALDIGLRIAQVLDSIGIKMGSYVGKSSNVKKAMFGGKPTMFKPRALETLRGFNGTFDDALKLIEEEAKYIVNATDAEKMAFLNNVNEYKEFGGPPKRSGILNTDEAKNLTDEAKDLETSITDLQTTAQSMKDEATANLKSAEDDLATFFETGGNPLNKKDKKFLGGSMSEEGQIRTGIREFLKKEYKNGRINLDEADAQKILQYSPMSADDPILVFKKIYGDEAYNKAGTFPGAFDVGESYNHYESIFRSKMGEDFLKVKDKKYVGDGKLVLTESEEVFTPSKFDDDIPFAEGGIADIRVGFVKGKAATAAKNTVKQIIEYITSKFTPIDAMKEVNKVIGKTGKYKNLKLTQKDIDEIVENTEDFIFQRDPDNQFVEGSIKEKTEYLDKDDVLERDLFAPKSDTQVFKDSEGGIKGITMGGDDEFKKAISEAMEEGIRESENMKRFGLDPSKIGDFDKYEKMKELGQLEKNVTGLDDMSESETLMKKYPGMDKKLAEQIATSEPIKKADLIAMVEQTFKMSEQGMSGDDIIQAFKNTPRTKQADGGITQLRNGYSNGLSVDPERDSFKKISNVLGAYRRYRRGEKNPALNFNQFFELFATENFAKGGRAGYYGGGQAMVGEDLSQIGHGSDSLMARNMQLAPNSMATTSTGLNYLLGEDNDTVRVPYNEGNMVLPKAKPTQSPLVELSRIYKTYEEAMPGVSKDTQQFLRNDFKEKLNNAKISVEEFMTYRMQNNLADGGRIGFQDGLNFKKFYENKLEKSIDKMLEKETEEYKPMDISAEGEKILKEKFNSLTPNETEKEKEERKMFEMVEEFKTLKKKGIIRPDLSFRNFQKMKEQRLVKNKILELDIKYPEKEIINKETGALNEKNLKSAIDQAQVDLEISPIDGLKLKRFINTEGEQSVTGGEYTTGNFNFSSDNIEEGKLTSKGNFNFGGIDLSGMVNSNDGEILNTELGFNYDNALKGKMTESDGYRSGKLELDKNFTLPTETKFGYKTMFTPKNKKLKNVIDNLDFGIKGKYDISSFDGQTYKSSDLTPKLSYNDGILSADISKEIMDGGNFNLNAGASFPINQKTFTGDLILDANGEPTYNSDGSLKRKQSYNTDMGVVTLKGNNLFTDNMGGTVGYEKTFGDRDGDLFFTAGAEKNIFDDGYTGSVGIKSTFADGGIAGLRQNYGVGGGVNLARRGFLKVLAGTAAGVAAFKTGALKLLGKTATTKVAPKLFAAEAGSGAPAWFEGMVNKVLADGVDITKKAATMDGQVVKSLDTPTGKVDVTIDRTGNVDVNYMGDNTAMGEGVDMRYVVGQADETTKAKPFDEFEAVESVPEFQGGNYMDGPDLGFGENSVSEVKNLYSDVSELQTLGGDKRLINDISVTLQKKKTLKQMNENPQEFAQDMDPDVYYDD